MGDPREEQLVRLAARLRHRADLAEVRGRGQARFLYVTLKGRAVEASFDDDGLVWVEFWEADEDEDAASVNEYTFASVETAEQGIHEWLS